MHAVVLQGTTALEDIGPAYDALAVATGLPVTARRPWLQTALETYPGEPLVVAVYDDAPPGTEPPRTALPGTEPPSPLLAAVAVLTAAGRRPRRYGAAAPGATDTHALPARSPAAADALAEALIGHLASTAPWQLAVDQLPVDDPVCLRLVARLPLAELRPGDPSPRLRVRDGDRTIGSYVSRNTRGKERQALNRCAGDGREVRVSATGDPEGVAALLPALAAVHRARDVELGRRSDLDDPVYAAFWRRLIVEHAARGELELHTCHLDAELAAYAVVFLDGRSMRCWDTRVSPAHAAYSPGRFVHFALVRRTLEAYDELDWMRGEERYKASFATDVVPAIDLWAFSSRAARAPHTAVTAARALKARSPALGRAWTRVRAARGR